MAGVAAFSTGLAGATTGDFFSMTFVDPHDAKSNGMIPTKRKGERLITVYHNAERELLGFFWRVPHRSSRAVRFPSRPGQDPPAHRIRHTHGFPWLQRMS